MPVAFRPDDVIEVVSNLPGQPVHHLDLRFDVHAGVAPFIVGQAGHMNAVPFAGNGHRRNAIGAGLEWLEPVFSALWRRPVPQLDGAGFRNDHPLAQVSRDFIRHDQNRGPVGFTQIKGRDRQIEKLLRRCRRQGDDFIMAVRPPPCLHHVPLGPQGGQSRGGTCPLNIDHHARGFRADAEPQVFHDQAEARARRWRSCS